MKKLLITLAALCASYVHAASPAATQEWVRRYCATNTKITVTSQVIEQSMTVDDETATLNMTLSRAIEPAWRISESSVTGMPVGVNFALDDFGNACNYTNTACTIIYQTPSTNWIYVVGGVTNHVTVAQLDFTVNGISFRGYEDIRNGEVVAAGLTQKTGIVRFRRAYVTKGVKANLTTPRTSLTLIDLLFGTAYADWKLDETWELDPNAKENPKIVEREDGGRTYTYYWVAHYTWDGMNSCIEVEAITAKFTSGQTYSFDVGYLSDALVEIGSKNCQTVPYLPDRAEYEADLMNSIYDACEEALADNKKTLAVFRKMRNAESFDAQMRDYFKTVLDAIYVSKTCETKTTTEEQDPEAEEPVPNPPTEPQTHLPPITDCDHQNVICTSTQLDCIFSCAVCKTVLDKKTHHFRNTSGHCAVCDNTYFGVTCRMASARRSDHSFTDEDGNGYGGTAEGCYCKHHHIWVPHDALSTDTTKWLHDAKTHWREKKCATCGWHGGKFDQYEHYPLTSVTFIDDTSHTYTSVCYTCKHILESGNQAHSPISELPSRFIDKKNGTHDYYLICKASPDGCGSEYLAGNEAHTKGGALILPPENLGEDGHRTNAVCAAVGCGGAITGETVAHNLDTWKLNNSWMLDDERLCACGYSTNVAHTIAFSEIVHWCANGDTHLLGVHDWDADNTNKCSVCGFIRGTSGDLRQTRTVYSACQHCFVTETRFRDSVDTEWGLWHISSENCKYGWNYINNSCGCDACQGGNTSSCWCEHGKPKQKWLVKITDSIVEKGATYTFAYAGNKDITTIDGDDPVYEIKAYALEYAFTNCVNLTTVKFNYVTNVGDYSFSSAFVGCTNLTTIQFQRLKYIGTESFSFCSNFTNINMNSVSYICGGAFYDCKGLESASFSSALYIGSYAFIGCSSLKDISIPSAAIIGKGVFMNCTNLKSISLPSIDVVQSNPLAFESSSITDIYVSQTTISGITSSNYLGASSGCVFHCADGDVTVP